MSNTYTFTEWQMKLLSNIFRIVVKEIKCDEDKLLLAPGEIGVSYTEGCFYVRNPHTGDIFCPNSIAHVNQILEKFDPYTNLLNADKVCGIRFYSDISQLSQLGISLSVDSVIRQMEYPSILMSSIDYYNYDILGYPSRTGMILIHKINDTCVTVSFYDPSTFTSYNGKYNPARQYFEGWTLDGTVDTEYAETSGGGDRADIIVKQEIMDMTAISVRVTEILDANAVISVNHGEYLPIIYSDGRPLDTQIQPNNIIMLIYDEHRKSWVYLNPSESSVSTVLSIMNDRLSDITEKLDNTIANLNRVKSELSDRIDDLSASVDKEIARLENQPGKIVSIVSLYVIENENTTVIPIIEGFSSTVDKLLINYNQTVLRENIDYIIKNNGVQMISGNFSVGDTLQFIVLKQPDTTK